VKRNLDLGGRVIVITGGARGIGAEAARRLAARGATVVVADIDVGALVGLETEFAAGGGCHLFRRVDVTRPAELAGLVAECRNAFGGVDVLVHCAAIVRPGCVNDLPEEAIRNQVEVNLLGTMFTTRAFLPLFLEQGRGRIVLVASMGGIAPMPGEAIYCATKFGVRGFGQALALELRHTPITISVVCPDSVDTLQLREEARRHGSSLNFTSQALEPHDVARAIIRTIEHPRPEVLIPGPRGLLVKWLNLSPRIMNWVYPLLDRLGERGREKFLARLVAREAHS